MNIDKLAEEFMHWDPKAVAKYVQKLILQARIDEAKKWYSGEIFPFEKTTGYKELKDQLNALEEKEK